jgi:hypothetical protein
MKRLARSCWLQSARDEETSPCSRPSSVVAFPVPDRRSTSRLAAQDRRYCCYTAIPRPMWPGTALPSARPGFYRRRHRPARMWGSSAPHSDEHHRTYSKRTMTADQRLFGFALSAQDHEIIRVGHDTRAEALLQPELLPSQHEPAHVEIRQQR